MLSFNLQDSSPCSVYADCFGKQRQCVSHVSCLYVQILRKLAPPCQRSLGQSCYADVLWSVVIKIRHVCDQRTCWVVSAPLVAGTHMALVQLPVIPLTQMNAFSISGCIKTTDAARGYMSLQQLNHTRWFFVNPALRTSDWATAHIPLGFWKYRESKMSHFFLRVHANIICKMILYLEI